MSMFMVYLSIYLELYNELRGLDVDYKNNPEMRTFSSGQFCLLFNFFYRLFLCSLYVFGAYLFNQ